MGKSFLATIRTSAVAIALGTCIVAVCAARAEPAATRPAPPDAAAVDKAAATIDGIYRDELAKAPDAATELVTAKNILQAAAQEKDPAARYAMFGKAADLAAKAGDIDTAMLGADQIDAAWDVDSSKLRTRILLELSRHVRSAQSRAALLRLLQTGAAGALADGHYDEARDLINAAIAGAREENDSRLTDELAAQAAEITRIRSAHDRIAPAILTLKSKPADSAANFVVGRFKCFVVGDWKSGLPELAAGSDASLKSLARKELAAGASPEDRALTADRWWDFSKDVDEPSRLQIQRHAAELYRGAIADLSGPLKTRAQQRIELAAGTAPPLMPPAIASGIKLLNLTNAREAGQILADVLRAYPDVLKDAKQATLVRYHDGIAYQRIGAGASGSAAAFSLSPASADSDSFLFWGVNDPYEPGRYLIVSRIQPLAPPGDGKVAQMDMYTTGGAGLTGHELKANEIEVGRWSVVPMVIKLSEPTQADCRMYTKARRQMALDRVYVFRLQ